MRAFFITLFVLFMANPAQASVSDVLQQLEKKAYDKAYNAARASGNATLTDYALWQRWIKTAAEPSFNEIAALLNRHPDWPSANVIQIKAEAAMLRELIFDQTIDETKVKNFFKQFPVISGRGKIVQLRLNLVPANQQERLIQDAWQTGDFAANEEGYVLLNYRNQLNSAMHWARAERLLWQDKTRGAERMLPMLSVNQQKLAKARIALIRRARNVEAAVNAVPSTLQNDAGLMFDRIRWRHKKRLYSGVVELLHKAPTQVPYPEKWWRYRAYQAREAYERKHYKEAEKLLLKHGQREGAPMAEALWMLGWIQLEYLNKPKQALSQFATMHANVGTPVSLARAAYWAGRASTKLGDKASATKWYGAAAIHPTTFYGQLAHHAIQGGAGFKVATSTISASGQSVAFNDASITKDIKNLYSSGASELADTLLQHAVATYPYPAFAKDAAAFAKSNMRTHAGVKVAKQALRKKNILLRAGWPRVKITNSGVSEEFALAIARQESEMKHDAVSHAGARGLMQLMPPTARKMAQKVGVDYSNSKLDVPAYNSQLGTAYLREMLDYYNGSYVLAIAAYNAGPGNVNKWIDRFGYPPTELAGAINWMESIPFRETRNYVQRVFENMQVYRAQLKPSAPLQIVKDITD